MLAIFSLPCQGESFSAKRAGQGFTSITQDFTSSISNPALLTSYEDTDDLYFSLNFGILGSDQYGIRDISKTIGEELTGFQQDINTFPLEYSEDEFIDQADQIVTNLAEIDNKTISAREGLNAQIIIPNKYLSIGMFVNQYARAGGIADYNENDQAKLNQAITDAINYNQSPDLGAPPYFDLNTLESNAKSIAYSITESGLMLGKRILNHVHYDLSIGTKIKYQRIDLYSKKIMVSEFNDINNTLSFDHDKFIDSTESINVDLGFHVEWGEQRQWSLALVTNNLIPQAVTFKDDDLTFKLDTSSILGFSYQNEWVTLSTELDLINRESFEQLEPAQFIAAGAELHIAKNMQFRLGRKQDINNNEPHLYTIGIGVSPFNTLSFDIAAFTGDKSTAGVALEFGLKI